MNEKEIDTHTEILTLLRENAELTKQNNILLKKMYRNDMIGLWLRVVWYAVLIGLPFALYFYVLQPYFEAFGSDYDLFRQGIGEIPGLKGLENLLPQ
ncbi:hypothetical protein IPH92_02530 [Candidatus Kaiserbacteria bacterium]|nr:MAG: hypothetical protein IPH92_02530 [Candidatus Kaiserbacteria bacterium]